MPRLPRIQFPGAIYHIVNRPNARQTVFHDDGHYKRITRGLVVAVERSAWKVISYCWMPNHIHLLIRTPEANLSGRMQHWLLGCANWYAQLNRRGGPLFQGRYKSFLVADAGYFWTLCRTIHVNPCVGSRPLAPARWPHSSYAGYAGYAGYARVVAVS